jgi:hypothetical protein
MNSPAAWLINFAIPVFWPFLRFIVALVSNGRIPVSKRVVLGYGVVVLVTLVTLLVVRASGAVSSALTFVVPVIWVAFVAAIGNDAWALWRNRQTTVLGGK